MFEERTAASTSAAPAHSGDWSCLLSLALHEWVTDILISVMATDTSASPVDLSEGQHHIWRKQQTGLMCMRDLIFSRLMLHNVRLIPKANEFLKWSEKSSFSGGFCRKVCQNAEIGEAVARVFFTKAAILHWMCKMHSCIMLLLSGSFCSWIQNCKNVWISNCCCRNWVLSKLQICFFCHWLFSWFGAAFK